jgi:ABC-2 type transport system permease protein
MMSVFEAAWVIARRDFVATVYSRSFIIFLVIPLVVFAAMVMVGNAVEERASAQGPQVAVVADSATVQALNDARTRLVAATTERSFPVLRAVPPAENVTVQAGRLLADDETGYSAVFSGTLDRPILTGPAKIEGFVGKRMGLIISDARRVAALQAAGRPTAYPAVARVITAQAAGNLQEIRRDIAQTIQTIIFIITVMLATLLLSNLAEEKTNKVIEVLAASVPLDAVFLGKLIAMLGISFVGLALWGGLIGIAYLFVQVVQDFVTLPQVGPAVGWPVFVPLVLIYYGANYMLSGALFLCIGGQASNIREIQTLTMPVTLLQAGVFFLAMTVVGSNGGALTWFAFIFPFSSPMAMIAHASEYGTLWPHLLAIAWQALWIALIIRLSARMFRRTVLKSTPGGSFFNLSAWRGRTAE